MEDYKELIERLNHYGLSNGASLGWHSGIADEAADAITTLTAKVEELEKKNQGLKANKVIMEKILEGKHNPHDRALIDQQMLQIAQLRAELEQVTSQRDAYKGTLDSANQTCAAMAKKLEQMAQERDAAVEDIEEILRLEHDTDICRYCNRIKHCAEYGCEESARCRGTQKEE